MKKSLLFTIVCFSSFFVSQNTVAEDRSGDFYVLGGLGISTITLNAVVVDTNFTGSGLRISGNYRYTTNVRFGVHSHTARLAGDDSTLLGSLAKDVDLSIFGLYSDYVFDSGFYLGGTFSNITLAYDEAGVKETTSTEFGLRFGGFWSLDNNLLLDLLYESFTLDEPFNESKFARYQVLGSLVFSIGISF